MKQLPRRKFWPKNNWGQSHLILFKPLIIIEAVHNNGNT